MVKALPLASESSHFDGNQVPSLVAVQGTLGTSDVTGSAPTVPLAANPATGALFVQTTGGNATDPNTGTLNTLGTVGTVLGIGGTVQVSGASAGTNVNVITGTTAISDFVNTANIANLGTGALGTANQKALLTAPGNMELNGSVTSAQIIIPSTDVSQFKWMSIQLLNTYVGSVALQASNDNSNFVNQAVMGIGSTSAVWGTQLVGPTIAYSPVWARYYRLNAVSYTSGTVQALMEFSSAPASGVQTMGVTAAQNGGWNVAITSSNGTILNLASGTLAALASGTITGGTLQNLVSGTINALAAGTITGGTLQNLATGTLNAVTTVTTVSNLTNGSVTMQVGTVTTGSLSNVALINAGTINALGIGTVLKSSPAASAGSFTAAGSVVITGSQYDAAAFDLQGTWVGTTFFEGQIGTSAWFSIPAVSAGGVSVGSAIANGDYFVDMSSLDGARARLTFSSGTQTYNARASAFESNSVALVGGSLNILANMPGAGTPGFVAPTQAIYLAAINFSGNLVGVQTGGRLSDNVDPDNTPGFINYVYRGGNRADRQYESNLSANTTGVGVVAAGIQGQDTGGTYHNLAVTTGGSIGTLLSVMTAGTLSPIPTIGQSTFGTLGTTGANVFGTLVGGTGSGAGTEIFVTSISLSIPMNAGSQDVSIGFGTNGGAAHTGTGAIVRGMFPVGGGIEKTFNPPLNSGTNAQLTYFQTGAGTAHIHVSYFTTTSTL